MLLEHAPAWIQLTPTEQDCGTNAWLVGADADFVILREFVPVILAEFTIDTGLYEFDNELLIVLISSKR